MPQRLKPSSFKAFTYGLKPVPFKDRSFSAALLSSYSSKIGVFSAALLSPSLHKYEFFRSL
jgi:hypothetical protein